MHTVVLERIERLVPEGSSPRCAMRVVRDLKTQKVHKAVMGETLRRIAESGEDVPLAEAIRNGGGLPIAAFPARLLDSRSAKQ
jgi:hypothetical protein